MTLGDFALMLIDDTKKKVNKLLREVEELQRSVGRKKIRKKNNRRKRLRR